MPHGCVLVGEEPVEVSPEAWRLRRDGGRLASPEVRPEPRLRHGRERRPGTVGGFRTRSATYPWQWTPADLENWVAGLRTREGRANSTIRSYGLTIGAFLDYVCDPAYGWDSVCLGLFGTHAVQICSAANIAVHTVDHEARPAGVPSPGPSARRCSTPPTTGPTTVRRRGPRAGRRRSVTPPC